MNLYKLKWYLATNICRFRFGKLGKHSYVAKAIFVQRYKRLYIGNNVRIYPGMRAEITKENARIIFQDNVSVGQNFHVVTYNEDLVIGENTTISGNVFISNVDHGYKELGVSVLEQEVEEKHTEIGRNCFIGYGAVILPGTVLGNNCIVGANSVVKGKFEDDCVIAGNPARRLKKYDEALGEWVRI